MDFNEFSIIVEQTKARNPIWFGLESDPVGTDSDFTRIQRQLSVKLPDEYKLFIKMFGGGFFAFTNIFSVKDSEWNIVQKNNEIDLMKSHAFLAISDNEVGDFYGFEIINGVCNSKIKIFNHETGDIEETPYENIYYYLKEIGLKI
ncbi:SMI1/KNR4 family protein [Fictibacillus halophilus]|uniref:SMI1/KNR4 family protein n=1 Tax=Fictibacillus halophilus TaxID=1610490 RepID=UPI001CF93CFE|nr:SMI1/KNR4 family protein [Fictibacillus halophilus]